MDFDVVVIGGGSAGYAAANAAQSAGARVGIVDKGPLGGLCILRGCMPTKTILRHAQRGANHEASVRILGRIRVPRFLFDILERDESAQVTFFIYHR